MTLLERANFDYGNARLRARRADLLTDADYERMLGADVDALLAALQQTGYASDLATSDGGIRAVHRAVRSHLGRALEDMRSFYSGRARELVDALLARFDVHNVIALLRARSHAAIDVEDALAAVTPVGWLTEPVAREILRAQELAGIVDLLAASAPDRTQATVLRAALSEYERTGDLAGVERAVAGEHAARVASGIRRCSEVGATLLRFAQRETDEHNVLVTLRLRDAIASGADGTPAPPEILLDGGSIPLPVLAVVVRAPDARGVTAALRPFGSDAWRSALERWAATGSLAGLLRSFERDRLADAVALFVTGDPLAIDVPLAFSTAAQVEARNLRLLGEAAVRGISTDVVRRELVWPGGRR